MKLHCMLFSIVFICLIFGSGIDLVVAQERVVAREVMDDVSKRVPAYTPDDARRYTDPEAVFQMPYAIHYKGPLSGPTTGVLDVSPEYEVQEGIIFTWNAGWNALVTEMTREAADAANNSKVFMVVANSTHQTQCYNTLSGAGVDMDQVEFITHQIDTVWCRDFGPHLGFHDGVRIVTDSHYSTSGSRPNDDATPVSVADQLKMPLYDMPLVYSGGNYLSTSNKHGYVTNIILGHNSGLTQTDVNNLFYKYQGVETLHMFQGFPYSIDGTGHIDMWMYILSDDKVIIGQYEQITPTYQAYVITENAVTYMQGLGFTVYRVPNHNSGSGGYNGTHYTYTNGFMLNNKMFISRYGGSHATNDLAALNTFQTALPSHEIIQVNSAAIIPYAGAIHCISMHVPAYEQSDPCAKVLYPNGGELWAANRKHDIRWAADDDEVVVNVDLYLSVDGGATFPYVIATAEKNDGVYEDYTVPNSLNEQDCCIKVVARDRDLNESPDVSDADYGSDQCMAKVYDFSKGANVNKWGYGSYVANWIYLNETRIPSTCNTPIDHFHANAYNQLAYSDATGGTSDPNRYKNPKETGRFNTLIFVFKIGQRAESVRSFEFTWEGFTSLCGHTEMYIWDDVEGNWGDGKGNFGKNNFMDNCSNLNDRIMRGGIYTDAQRYITEDNEVTLVIHTDKVTRDTYHDYVEMVVQYDPLFADVDTPSLMEE